MIRVELPQHLRTLAHVGREVEIEVDGAVIGLRAVWRQSKHVFLGRGVSSI